MKTHLRHMNALRAFEAAGRLGRMTAAAAELHVTPGAVSRQVRQLEEALGAPLFEGTKNKPVLTPAGQLLQPALSAAFAQIERAVDDALQRQAATLDVMCLSTFTMRWLIPRLYDYNARHPTISVRLQATDASAQPPRHDVAITVEDAAAGNDGTLLFNERLGPVLSPALAAQLKLTSARQLAGQPLLQTRTRRNAWAMWRNAAGTDVQLTSGPEFEHYYFTLEAAVAGLGIAVAPWHLVMDDVRSGRLIAPLGFCASGYRYVAKPMQVASPAAPGFCDWLRAQALDMAQPAGA